MWNLLILFGLDGACSVSTVLYGTSAQKRVALREIWQITTNPTEYSLKDLIPTMGIEEIFLWCVGANNYSPLHNIWNLLILWVLDGACEVSTVFIYSGALAWFGYAHQPTLSDQERVASREKGQIATNPTEYYLKDLNPYNGNRRNIHGCV